MSLTDTVKIELKYGQTGDFQCEIPSERVICYHQSPEPLSDVKQKMQQALNSPLELPPLNLAIVPGDKITILVDPQDRVWAGTWGGGAARWDGEKWTNFTTADGLAGNIVYSIAQDQTGALWFGTDHGLSRWDGQQWTRYGHAEGLLGEHVYAIAVTPTGEIWAGTRNGVSRLGRQPATTKTTTGGNQ